MNDDPNRSTDEENQRANKEAWQEVGQQFQQLGESLAQAVRAAWNDEENRKRVQAMQAGLESMVHEVSQAIDDTAHTPQGQKLHDDAQRTAQQLASAGEQAVQEIRPHLVSALDQLNIELQKLVNRMEKKQSRTANSQQPDQTDQKSG